jgi:DNA processing protein
MIRSLAPEEYPELLKEIPQPPQQLRYEGALPIKGNKLLAVVGSRKFSPYGKKACEALIAGLAGEPVTIVSGLALGMDSIAHRAALNNGLQTIAIPGSGLDRRFIAPRSHATLADEIVASGGGLMSEFEDQMLYPGPWIYPSRNRIMAGMCHATLVIEADAKSGTLITSRLATDYNREVGALPGPIDSSTSDGPHMLIRLGAALIRDHNDILELLGLKRKDEAQTLIDVDGLSDEEKKFIEILESPCSRDDLVQKSRLDSGVANAILSLLEIKGLIKEEMGEVRKTF